MEGSWHPNFMNPFKYGKSGIGKSFPTRIGNQTPPNPKIFRGAQCAPPPGFPIHQNRLGQIGLKAFPQRKLWLADLMVQLVRASRSSLCQPPTTAPSLICPVIEGPPQCPSCPEDDWWSVVVKTMVLALWLTRAFHGLQATLAGQTFTLWGTVLVFFF